MKTRFSLCVLLFLLFHSPLFSQSLFESATSRQTGVQDTPFNLNGYVRGTAYGAGKVYDYAYAFGEISLKPGLKTGLFRLTSDLRFRSGYQFGEPILQMEIKEAFAGISTNAFDLFLGEQIISWGRTDGFNPTNNITPNNYFFLTGNPDDQKMPNFLLRATWRIAPSIGWEFIALPFYRPSVYRYDLFDLGNNTSFVNAEMPEMNFENGGLATRLNFEFRTIGFAFSWFRGYDPFYGFDIKSIEFSTGVPVITFMPAFYQKNSFGVDFALPLGPVIWRGEAAFNLTENDEKKINIPASGIAYVSGIEVSTGPVMWLFQYIGNYVPDFQQPEQPTLSDPNNPLAQMQYASEMIYYESALLNQKIFNQQTEFHHAVTGTLRGSFFRETLILECPAYFDFTSESWLVRPKAELSIGNGLSITAGYSFMSGVDGSVFSHAAPIMNGAFLEMKASF